MLKGTHDEDFLADCSDEEVFLEEGVRLDEDTWTPKPEDVARLYTEISTKKVIETQWKCNGRRAPSATSESEGNAQGDMDSESQFTKAKAAQDEATAYDDFEKESIPQLRPKGTPKATSKKKPVTLESILSNMARHQIIDQEAVENESGGRPGQPGGTSNLSPS